MKRTKNKKIFTFDLESTGLNVAISRIVEIALYCPDNETPSFESLINPSVEIPRDTINIHGITNEMVKDAPGFVEAFKKMKSICGEECVLIAHNGDRFDEPMLRHEAKRYDVIIPEGWEFVDSLLWAKKYMSHLPKHNLQYLREYFKFEKNNAHRALDDTIILWKVFNAMTDDLAIEDIIEKIYGAPENTKIHFGKYKGKYVTEIPEDYIRWLYSSSTIFNPFNIQVKKAIEKLNLKPEYEIHLL